jgi:hypothetical protein
MRKEKILQNLQEEWDNNNSNYSEDGFKDYVCDYVDLHDEEGNCTDEDGDEIAVVDWVLNNLDLSR